VKPTEVVTIPVTGRAIVNAFLLLGRHAVVVDTGVPGSGPRILAALAEHGVTVSDVTAIVVTHGHIDHFGSAAYLREELGAPIVAHSADAAAYASGRSLAGSLRPTGPFGRVFGTMPPAHGHTEPFTPDVVLDRPTTLHEFGVAAEILHTPGHTPGSISVLTDTGEVLAADLIAGSFLGAVRRKPANPPFHLDRALNLDSLDAVLERGPSVIHVGHGGPLDPAHVRRWAGRERRKLARGRVRQS
jgi:glyoxylase-like metal-dependent hydrolase (beta-lactamase superfamily II)